MGVVVLTVVVLASCVLVGGHLLGVRGGLSLGRRYGYRLDLVTVSTGDLCMWRLGSGIWCLAVRPRRFLLHQRYLLHAPARRSAPLMSGSALLGLHPVS